MQTTDYCRCGCGEATNPGRRYRTGHNLRGNQMERSGPKPEPPIDLFEKRVVREDRGHSSECWIWQGFRNAHGYGHFSFRVRRGEYANKQAHLWRWELANGPVPDGLVIDHLCRNPSCVNPDHLEPVTHAENVRRGRSTKITMADAARIRELATTISQSEISKMFSLDTGHVCRIVNYKAWV
jgi:hypothetical protein